MQRIAALQTWLSQQLPEQTFELAPASADASFRRYFRVTLPDRTLVAMDAPPEHENCRPFLQVEQLFRAAGAHVPAVYGEDLAQGFLLLEDLGNRTYLDELNEESANALYLDAIDALIRIQLASRKDVLPIYDEPLLKREMDLFPEWYVARHLGQELSTKEQADLAGVMRSILDNNLAQPQVYVHRDYHSRNLMICEANPGILDFQDAVYGPITYDLVSLLKDAYIHWDEQQVLDWVIRYWERAKRAGLPVDPDIWAFYRDFEWMGVQRHLKVLGIFARLYHRDGKDGYLKDMPLVARYLRKACERYGALGPLLALLNRLEQHDTQVGYTF